MKLNIIISITIFLVIITSISYILINSYIIDMNNEAVAVFKTNNIYGDVIVNNFKSGVKLKAQFTKLPKGKHGFHIHKAGDLRGEGCQGLCDHYDIGNNSHGGEPNEKGERHTGDLGNIELKNGKFEKEYYIKGVSVRDLWGRSIIIHEEEDDLGRGGHEDSKTTGHSGTRIGCAIFGRGSCSKNNKTRKITRK
jgi:Cu-Zn family superoxide dismutase